MRVDYQVSALYDEGMKQIVSSAKHWKAVCQMTGRLYRYEFDNILMIYMQRPNATLVADYDTWKDPRVGRYVRRGSKGIAIFPSRALKPYMRYVFDISDTEVVDEDGNVKKADMFYKQTIRAKNQVERVETATEALNVSVSEFGTVNIPFMLSIYEPDISEEKKELPEGSTLSVNAGAEVKREVLLNELAGLIYLDPTEYNENNLSAGWKTADEYLSGNVRDKLRIAKAYAEENGELFAVNVQALEQVQPKDLDASEIEVRIGTTWIEPEDYEQFIYELLGTPNRAKAVRSQYYSSGIQVKFNTYGQNWSIQNKSLDKRSIAATKTYGTGRIDAYSIMEETLNLRTVTVRDRIEDGDGKYHYEINKKETMIAREKQNQMKEAFKSWIFKDQERRQKYVDYYNNTFNCML